MKAKLPGAHENPDVVLGSPGLLHELVMLQKCTDFAENPQAGSWSSKAVPAVGRSELTSGSRLRNILGYLTVEKLKPVVETVETFTRFCHFDGYVGQTSRHLAMKTITNDHLTFY